jgi:hypothetical protein
MRRLQDVKEIGGFFGLELPDRGEPFHRGLIGLSSGRGCLSAVLAHLRPRRLHVPFFICEAVVQAANKAHVEVLHYALGRDLLPLALPKPAIDEAVLLVNYFGIRGAEVAAAARSWAPRSIVDNTQAFFEAPVPTAWTFYSARKFFGVPDGAYLHGPSRIDVESFPMAQPPMGHLYRRLADEGRSAYEEYVRSEAAIDCEPKRMSRVSRQLLGAVDSETARHRRASNALHLHRSLEAINLLPGPLRDGCAPLCYPLLLDREVSREALAQRGLFVPTFWKEVPARPAAADFPWECTLASKLLPLPIDHRYDTADMDALLERLLPLISRGPA